MLNLRTNKSHLKIFIPTMVQFPDARGGRSGSGLSQAGLGRGRLDKYRFSAKASCHDPLTNYRRSEKRDASRPRLHIDKIKDQQWYKNYRWYAPPI